MPHRSFCTPGKSAYVNIFRAADDLPAAWDAALPKQHPMRSEFLRLYELVQQEDIQVFYAFTGTESQPETLAYFQLLRVQPRHLNAGLLSGLQRCAASGLLRLLKPGLLVAGHLFRHDVQTFFSAEEVSDFDAFKAYRSMIEAVERALCAQAVLVKDVPQKLVHFFQNFGERFLQLRNDISMEMELPASWINFADYEAALKHKYAQKLRKVRSGLESLEIREMNTDEVFAQKERLYALYMQVCKKQTFSMGFLSESFLPELKNKYGDSLKMWGFYEHGVLQAFASAWLHEDAFDMFYIGLDYARNNELNLYFNILYFSIEQAILHRKPLLVLGRTALEAKARLGCKPRYLHTFLSVKNKPLRNLVAARISRQHADEGAWEERHPFKPGKA